MLYLEGHQWQLFDADMSSKPEDIDRSIFLCSILAAQGGTDTFVYETVCAELTKFTVYMVGIKLDICGHLQESQCECGVGMRPLAYCKHVFVIHYALIKAAEGITCSETCTRRLQIFHHVKIEYLKLHPGGSLQSLVDLDPTQEEYMLY